MGVCFKKTTMQCCINKQIIMSRISAIVIFSYIHKSNVYIKMHKTKTISLCISWSFSLSLSFCFHFNKLKQPPFCTCCRCHVIPWWHRPDEHYTLGQNKPSVLRRNIIYFIHCAHVLNKQKVKYCSQSEFISCLCGATRHH